MTDITLDDAWIPDAVEVDDEHFPYWNHMTVEDTLTGLEVKHVVSCDQVRGVVVRHVTDTEGKKVLNAARDAVLTETIVGAFRLRWSENARQTLNPEHVKANLRK